MRKTALFPVFTGALLIGFARGFLRRWCRTISECLRTMRESTLLPILAMTLVLELLAEFRPPRLHSVQGGAPIHPDPQKGAFPTKLCGVVHRRPRTQRRSTLTSLSATRQLDGVQVPRVPIESTRGTMPAPVSGSPWRPPVSKPQHRPLKERSLPHLRDVKGKTCSFIKKDHVFLIEECCHQNVNGRRPVDLIRDSRQSLPNAFKRPVEEPLRLRGLHNRRVAEMMPPQLEVIFNNPPRFLRQE